MTHAFRTDDSPGCARPAHPRALAKRAADAATKRVADAACRRAGWLLPEDAEKKPTKLVAPPPVAQKPAKETPTEEHKRYLERIYPGIEQTDYDYDRWLAKRAADYAIERKAYLADYLQSLFKGYPEFTADLRKTGKIADIGTIDDFRREYTQWTDARYAEDARRQAGYRAAAEAKNATARGAHSAAEPVIEGSDAFKAVVRAALDLLRPLPSWRYTAGLKRIAADNSDSGWYCARTKTCFIGPTVAFDRDAQYLASFIVHEGAHALDQRPRGTADGLRAAEVVAFTAQLVALRELNASQTHVARIERCLANPLGHYTAREIEETIGRAPTETKVLEAVVLVMAFIVALTFVGVEAAVLVSLV